MYQKLPCMRTQKPAKCFIFSYNYINLHKFTFKTIDELNPMHKEENQEEIGRMLETLGLDSAFPWLFSWC